MAAPKLMRPLSVISGIDDIGWGSPDVEQSCADTAQGRGSSSVLAWIETVRDELMELSIRLRRTFLSVHDFYDAI